MKKLLWLDDYRDPKTNGWLVFSPITPDDVYWVRNYNEFVNWITSNGLPDAICFDHDLGDEHIKYFFENGGHDSPPDPLNAEFTEKTGYDCAKWLVNYCLDNNKSLPLWNIQSANPIGKANIHALLTNFNKRLS
jgi:hypothetical protein